MSPFRKGVTSNPAGRPSFPKGTRRVRLSTTVDPDTHAWLVEAAQDRDGIGEIIDELVDDAIDRGAKTAKKPNDDI